ASSALNGGVQHGREKMILAGPHRAVEEQPVTAEQALWPLFAYLPQPVYHFVLGRVIHVERLQSSAIARIALAELRLKPLQRRFALAGRIGGFVFFVLCFAPLLFL